MLSSILFSAQLFHGSLAIYSNYFPPPAEGLTVLQSRHDSDITLSYKQTDICESSYAGYVHLPASTLADMQAEYQMNMFFWFFPARESPETAPLSIWVGGGPGESAIAGAMMEAGPCYVNDDGNSTRSNPFSRNNRVNMLYIDQPVGAGYSYSTLVNVTYHQLTGLATPTDFSKGFGFTPNITVFPGTVSNPDLAVMPNNSDIAARAMWHFAQTWFDTFPVYHPENNRISLWTNSYGGYFGPAIFRNWESQNKKIESGELEAQYLHLDALGIENGCIDAISQLQSWPQYVFNNTYELQIINESVYNELIHNVTDPDTGCVSIIQKCRDVASVGDPQFYANNKTVNDVCALATEQCYSILAISTVYANRHYFDISQVGTQKFPGFSHIAFFNQRWVQQELGVPLNYTDNANLTMTYFLGTSDPFRQNQSSIEYLLDNDIQVALVYGDRDTRCNWIGVENVSLTVDYLDAQKFRSAGYADLRTNSSYTGGVVRQYDGFSFSRVFDAGHQVSAYQPETVYEIFDRVMFRRDVATGTVPIDTRRAPGSSNVTSTLSRLITKSRGEHIAEVQHYQSKGPSSSWSFKNVLPPSPPGVCNVWAAPPTCSTEQLAALANGTAITHDWIVTFPLA